MNPFNVNKGEPPTGKSVFFTDEVKKQITALEIGEAAKADLLGEELPKFRMTLRYVQGQKRFKTKINWDGELWIMRIK
tara:strand:+ start:261 stop:494 length:234 start_codon:yes stop_codon:yes gene_type:complete